MVCNTVTPFSIFSLLRSFNLKKENKLESRLFQGLTKRTDKKRMPIFKDQILQDSRSTCPQVVFISPSTNSGVPKTGQTHEGTTLTLTQFLTELATNRSVTKKNPGKRLGQLKTNKAV
jgi:hypothetical protein